MSTRTSIDARLAMAERVLAAERVGAPAASANRARNARAELGRHGRWAPARDAIWRMLDPEPTDGATVAIGGAGNGDTVPLARIAARASRVTLIDLDAEAIRAARRHQPRRLRRRTEVIEHDITAGCADALATAAQRRSPGAAAPPRGATPRRALRPRDRRSPLQPTAVPSRLQNRIKPPHSRS
jgi:hypothetical protein